MPTRKFFVSFADAIKEHNRCAVNNKDYARFTSSQLETIARFLKQQNGNFNQQLWIEYISGTVGPRGGSPRD